MCINIGISSNLIHITWPTWMRIVPCRVVCYYKFNVKSWSKKMREGGLGIWNGSIHLPFLLVSKCAQRKRKKSKARKADPEEEESFYTRPQGEAYFTLWSGTSGYPRLLFIHQWRYGRPILCACGFTFLLPVLFLRGKLYLFLTVIYRCTFLRVSFVMKAHVWSWTRFSIP